eukprot:4280461-Ditylum_brightwellii.AAC.1
MMDGYPKEFDGEAAILTSNRSFDINEKGDKLLSNNAKMFHHNVAKLLFLFKCARPNAAILVAFLNT